MEGYGAWALRPQAPRPARRGAGAATLRGPVELMAAQNAVYCFFIALFLLNATSAASIAASRAFGEDSLAADMAKKFLVEAVLTTEAVFCTFVYVAVFLLLWRVWKRVRKTETREEAEFGWGGLDCPLNGVGPVTNHIIIFLIMVMLLGMLMNVLAPRKESCEGRVGSMLTEIGSFHFSILFCFIFCRDNLTRLWASRDKVNRRTGRLC